MGQNVEWDKLSKRNNIEWDKMSNAKMSNGTKRRMGQIVEWDKMSNSKCIVSNLGYASLFQEKVDRMSRSFMVKCR
jgi:hypothetical protein